MKITASLKRALGSNHVLTDGQEKQAYDVDHTGDYKGNSLAVVRPGTVEEIVEIMRLARDHQTPVVPMGGNTGLCGGCFPGKEGTSLILSLERMNTILDINETARTLTVEAGAILETVHDAVEERGFVFPLTFGAKGSCRIGGVLSTNAGGSNVVRYGTTRALCLGLEVVTADGRVMNLMNALRKDNTGYDLRDLFIGAEGTLGIITKAVFKLFPKPERYATAIVALSGLDNALKLLNRLNDRSSGSVEAYEYMPGSYFELYRESFPDRPNFLEEYAEANVLIELGLAKEVDDVLPAVLAESFEEGWVTDAAIAQSESQRQTMWACREASLDVLLSKGQLLNTDISLPLDEVPTFIERMNARLSEIAPDARSMQITHLGDGNIHYSVWREPAGSIFDEKESKEIIEAIENLARDLRGSFSAEHGIGLCKVPAMTRHKDSVAVDAMRQIKAALDPLNILNPGKVLPSAAVGH